MAQTISVIIPAYNCENTLERAVLSAVNQTSPPAKIIIVDNGSTDGTIGIITKMERQFPGLIVALHEGRKGANYARNTGWRYAHSEWVQFLDADDVLLPDKLAHQQKIINDRSDIGVVYAPSQLYVKNKNSASYTFLRQVPAHNDLILGLIRAEAGRTHANLWKRHVLEVVGGWDEDVKSSQEYYLMLKLYKNGVPFYKDEQINTIIYREGDSISFTCNVEKAIDVLEDKLKYLNELYEHLFKRKEAKSYLNHIETVKNKVYYSELIEYAGDRIEGFRRLKVENSVKGNAALKILSYVHFVYGKYAFGKKNKYLLFGAYLIKELRRLFYH